MIGIGIDVGGTYVKFLAVDARGKALKTARIETDLKGGPGAFLKQIAAQVNEWKREFKKEKITIGIGLPGDVDNVRGVLRMAPNLKYRGKHLTNIKVADEIKKLTGIKPEVGNDATIAAWGVYELETKGKLKDVVVIALGTGVGGGLIIDGKLYQGANGCAGEIGHTKLDLSPDAPLCGCGAHGCTEAYVGTYGIKRIAAEIAAKNRNSLLAKAMAANKEFKIKIIYDAAASGCKSARAVWDTVGFYLGSCIANICMTLDLDAVILAGGISGAKKFFMPAVNKVLKAQKIKTPFKKLKILTSDKPEIGVSGAALYSMASAHAAKKENAKK